MTVNEVLFMNHEDYTEIEVYRANDRERHELHMDYMHDEENYNKSEKVVMYELMDEKEYNSTILANSCVSANFDDWYGDKNAKILVILLDEN